MSREDYEIFGILKAERQEQGEDRRALGELLFDPAQVLAKANGLALRRCTGVHYQLFPEGKRASAAHWLINLYPGNQRVYSPPERRGPYLNLKRPWTLLDAVQAAIRKECNRDRHA